MEKYTQEFIDKLKHDALICEIEGGKHFRHFSVKKEIPYYVLVENERMLIELVESEDRAIAQRYDISLYELGVFVINAELFIFLYNEKSDGTLTQLKNIYKKFGGGV